MISPIWLRDIYSNIVVDITYLSWIDITYFKRWFQFIRISDRSITHSIQVVSKIKIEMWHRLFEWYRIQKNYFTNIFECTKDAVFHEYEHHQIYFSHNRKNNWWFFIIFFLFNKIDWLIILQSNERLGHSFPQTWKYFFSSHYTFEKDFSDKLDLVIFHKV